MKLLTEIKNTLLGYQYYMITFIIGTLLFGGVYNYFPSLVVGILASISTLGLFGYVIYGLYRAIVNTWNDGDMLSKIMAIVFGTLGTGLITFIVYLILR